MPRARVITWVVMRKDRDDHEDGICLRCGEIFYMRKPIRLTVWTAGLTAFAKAHAHCQEKTDGR
jgi:hypothetical protein